MLNTFEDVVLIFVCVFASLLFLSLLQYFWPGTVRRVHNDVVGWQASVIGTTYAVLIGFMLYAVWTAFQTAEVNAAQEADSLVNVYRLADGLPQPQRDQIHQLAREYADTVVSQEWPAMHRGDLSLAGRPIVEALWATLVQTKPISTAEQASLSSALTEISNMTRYRRIRQLEGVSKLPGILWLVLILGGCITTLSACLFGTDNFKLHLALVLFLSLLISLTLIAIADIDRPFQGSVHVRPLGFERALQTFAQAPGDTH